MPTKYKHYTFCVFFCFVLLFVVLGAASLRPCIFSHLNPSTRMVLRNFGIRIPPSQVTLYQTVCIWLLHFFLLGANSIASKSTWTNSDLRSSRQLEENTEDKTEAGVKKSSNTLFNIVSISRFLSLEFPSFCHRWKLKKDFFRISPEISS